MEILNFGACNSDMQAAMRATLDFPVQLRRDQFHGNLAFPHSQLWRFFGQQNNTYSIFVLC